MIDPEGHPLVGVHLERRDDRGAGFQAFDLETLDELPVRDRVESAADGSFRFVLAGPRASHVSARADGRGEVVLSSCMPGEFLEITMPLACEIEGFVSESASGSPVPSARVRVFHGPEGGSIAETLTDERGHFELRNLTPGVLELQVIPVLHAMPRLRTVDAEAGRRVREDVEVDEGWVLAGRVLDRDTRVPIEGAEVSSWSFLGKNSVTDRQGRFRLEGVRTRPGTLTARASGYGRIEVAFGGPDEHLDLGLVRARGIHGRVVDPLGYPVVDARVSAVGGSHDGGSQWNEWKSEETDDAGRFRLEDLRSDVELGLFVRSSGHAATVFDLPAARPGSLDVGDLVLEAGILLNGRILDAGGQGIPRARVTLLGPERLALPGNFRDSARHRTASTDGQGRFQVFDLCAGPWRVSAQLSTRAGARAEFPEPLVLVSGELQRNQDWTVPEPAELHGAVRGHDGAPVEGAVVTLTREGVRRYSRLQTRSGVDGSFRVEGPADGGRWTLHVSVPEDRQPGSGAPFLPMASKGLELDGRYMDIELLRAEALVDGRVVGPDGEPIPQALVTLDAGDGQLRDGVLAGSDGRFTLLVPSSAPFTLHAWRTRPLGSEDTSSLLRLEWELKRRIVEPLQPGATHSDLDATMQGVTLRLSR